ncbi:hypothetical protein FOL47_011386 [Perkinsus chesapeaki]|uniref:Uncharacterized protein n=1 Tax=Perkinsus chesapeaki TaxID=330153 RepID=A0A7J6KZ96_PERCH|nr:hypothetical protein FOL47_011386 [Perkinsus chesapeaki]
MHPIHFLYLFISCWSICMFNGCSEQSPNNEGNAVTNITATGVTTTPSGKKWASVDVEVTNGAARYAKIKLKTDSVSTWPIIGYGGSVIERTGNEIKQLNDAKRKEFIDA